MLMVDVVPLTIDIKADVIAFCMHWQMLYQWCGRFVGECRLMLLPFCFFRRFFLVRLLLLPIFIMADVIAMWQMFCHCFFFFFEADVITSIDMADVIACLFMADVKQ